MLRFDFTGLGGSEGDFSNTDFSSNVEDLIAAAQALATQKGQAPSLLVGHSLGGAAVLQAAHSLPKVLAVVTIGAPCDPGHVTHLFGEKLGEIQNGSASVRLGGREFQIKQQFLEDLNRQDPKSAIGSLRKPLLIFHSPTDQLVGIENARRIYEAAQHPKSFISLDQADHLLSSRADSEYVAETLAAWASRYLKEETSETSTSPESKSTEEGVVLVEEQGGSFTQHIFVGKHQLIGDEPEKLGGHDLGPSPYGYLLASLGCCTSMTLRMYAKHKKLPLEQVKVTLRHNRVHAQDCKECTDEQKQKAVGGKIDEIYKEIELVGPDLTEEQRNRLMEIADRCPVNRTLLNEKRIIGTLKKN